MLVIEQLCDVILYETPVSPTLPLKNMTWASLLALFQVLIVHNVCKPQEQIYMKPDLPLPHFLGIKAFNFYPQTHEPSWRIYAGHFTASDLLRRLLGLESRWSVCPPVGPLRHRMELE